MIRTFFLFDPQPAGDFGRACAEICRAAGFAEADRPEDAEFGLGPRVMRKLPRSEWSAPRLGTLLFHPSVLPYHRGPDAVRWALALGERVSGVTWFWADEGLDTGPVCEQEPVLPDPSASPGRNYHTRFVPAGLRALRRAVGALARGEVWREPQEERLASYESLLPDQLRCGGQVVRRGDLEVVQAVLQSRPGTLACDNERAVVDCPL